MENTMKRVKRSLLVSVTILTTLITVSLNAQAPRLRLISQSVTGHYTADGYGQPSLITKSVNVSSEPVAEHYFQSSTNILDTILDEDGRTVPFSVTREPGIYNFTVKLNKPVLPGDTLELTMKDKKQKIYQGRNDVYAYSKRHIPGPEIDYAEKVILDKNLTLLYRTPEPQRQYTEGERTILEYSTHLTAGEAFRVKVLYRIVPASNDSPDRLADESGAPADSESDKKYYLAIEMNGTLCGYSVITEQEITGEGKTYTALNQKLNISFAVLGQDMVQYQEFNYHLDKETGNFFYHDSFIERGDVSMSSECTVTGRTLSFTTPDGSDDTSIDIPEQTILPNTFYFPHLQRDFAGTGVTSKTYKIYNPRTGSVQEYTYTLKEQIEENYAGKNFQMLILEEKDDITDITTELSIDVATGRRLAFSAPIHLRMYLTDAAVVNKTGICNWDELVFTKTNKLIKNIHAISSMEVEAELSTVPKVQREDLTLAGQDFSGAVTDGRISGTFRMEYETYNGEGAPAFPADKQQSGSPDKYLKPEPLIESNDSKIIEKAEQITRGAADSWEASGRLAAWVGSNIGGLGGGSALMTLESGKGMCAEQSRLMTAFCRAVGIPARVVWGVMYVPEKGGSFGSHSWVEVHMGKSGWIPIDQSIDEYDYVNAGHIRFGELSSMMTQIDYEGMTIKAYRLEK